MSGLRGVTLTVRFLCGLGMLVALAYWGTRTGEGVWAIVLAVAAPLAAASVWWAFVAPKARWPVPLGARVAIEFVLFGIATVALWSAGAPIPAAVLGVLAATTSVLNAFQERAERSAT